MLNIPKKRSEECKKNNRIRIKIKRTIRIGVRKGVK